MSHIVFTSLFSLSSKCRELGDPSHPDSPPCPFMCNKHGGGGLTWISTLMRLTTLSLVVLGLPSFPVIQHPWLISYHIRAVTFSCKYQLQATPPTTPLPCRAACKLKGWSWLLTCCWPSLAASVGIRRLLRTDWDRGRSLSYFLQSWYKYDNYSRGSWGFGQGRSEISVVLNAEVDISAFTKMEDYWLLQKNSRSSYYGYFNFGVLWWAFQNKAKPMSRPRGVQKQSFSANETASYLVWKK